MSPYYPAIDDYFIFLIFRQVFFILVSFLGYSGLRRFRIARVVVDIFPAVKLPPWWAVPVIWRFYRHILVIPPTANVLPPKNENRPPPKHYHRIALPPKKYRHILVYRFRHKSTANPRYRQEVPPKEYRQLSIPLKRYPTLDTAQKVPPTLDIAQKVPPILDTAEKVPTFVFLFVLCSIVLSGSSGSFSVDALFGREDREAPRHLPIHQPPDLPTPRSAWSSRTMSG